MLSKSKKPNSVKIPQQVTKIPEEIANDLHSIELQPISTVRA